jgi:protein subunit release factor A
MNNNNNNNNYNNLIKDINNSLHSIKFWTEYNNIIQLNISNKDKIILLKSILESNLVNSNVFTELKNFQNVNVNKNKNKNIFNKAKSHKENNEKFLNDVKKMINIAEKESHSEKFWNEFYKLFNDNTIIYKYKILLLKPLLNNDNKNTNVGKITFKEYLKNI